MTTRIRASILAAAVLSLGCDSPFDPVADGADAFPEPVIAGFGGTLTGTAPLAAGLDPALLRVGAFRTRQEVTTELDNGDLDEADMALSVHLNDATAQALPVAPNPPTGVARYFFEEALPAMVEGDAPHAWSLELPEPGTGEYVVLGWYDADGDGTLALTPDGEGSEYSVLPVKAVPEVGPDARLTLELVWREGDTWLGNAAGPTGNDGTFFEEPLADAGPDGWEAEVAGALR
jgi:hypothetical protein